MTGGRRRVEIAEARPGDIDAVAAFFREAWHEAGPDAPGFAGASDAAIAEITAPAALAGRIGGPERRMLLAWEGRRVVGFAATAHVDPATVELAGIVVLSGRAGRGIGGRLTRAAAEAMRAAGYQTMTVKTEATNEGAIAFYTKLGFAATGTTTEHIDDLSIDVVQLVLDLV